MKKYLLLAVVVLFFANANVFAGQVTVADAQQVALNFFKLNATAGHAGAVPALIYTQTETDNTIDFYVFDMSPAKGFVIVAGDDNVKPVLGYSTESNFNSNYQHIGLSRWMHKTAANIHLALLHNALADSKIAGQWSAYRAGQNPVLEKSAAVSPLVTTTWDQENDVTSPPPYLYNLLCPWNATDHQRCLTGCVATAQAQVMKYWNYPAVGRDTFSYLDNTANGYSYNYGRQFSNFAAHHYNWTEMPSVLTGNEPLVQDSAVDVLMYDCAVSVGMDFGDDNQDGSGANALLAEELPNDSFCSQYALVKYFLYNPDTIKGVFEANFTSAAWIAMIEHEMNVGRPVIYEGNDASQGGHAWVCDGYDADNHLHMNWGWSGFDNGYFAINNLTTSGDFNPVQQDDALIGILPLYPRAPITNFTAVLTNTCTGTVQFNDFSQELPTSWLWNFGDNTTSTLQNPIHTYAANGTYTVSLTATNAAGSTPLTLVNYITIDMQDSTAALTGYAGPVQRLTTGASVEPDPYAVQFNVLKPCILKSVFVYSQTAGNRTIQVLDTMGYVVAQATAACDTGGSRLTLNLNLNAGGPYFMQVGGIGDTVGLYRDTAGAAYPYTDSLGLVSITGNTAYAPTYYYYFYDWIVESPDCPFSQISGHDSVQTGVINTAGSDISFNMFPNPAANEVVLQTANTGNEITWTLRNILGQTLLVKNAEATQTKIDITNLSTGVYLVELKDGEKTAVKKLVVNR